MDGAPRSGARRRLDALNALGARHADVWVASASAGGRAHLVPLSFGWTGELVILAVASDAVTARNISSAREARLAFGTSRDVVMVDAWLDDTVAIADAPGIAERYAAQADWDPREADGPYVFLLLRPHRIQVWREADEIAGRNVMRESEWLV
jgi:hypothetical protein